MPTTEFPLVDHLDKVTALGLFTCGGGNGIRYGDGVFSTALDADGQPVGGWPIEMVVRGTTIEMQVNPAADGASLLWYSVDGGAVTLLTSGATDWTFVTVADGLADDEHLLQIVSDARGAYLYSVQLTGADPAIVSVARAQTFHAAPLVTTDPDASWTRAARLIRHGGAYSLPSVLAQADLYTGYRQSVRFTGTQIGVISVSNSVCYTRARVDGVLAPLPLRTTPGGGFYGLSALARNLDGGTHEVEMTLVAPSTNVGFVELVGYVGARLAGDHASGLTTLTMDDTATIGVGDWVLIGSLPVREYRRVTAKTATTVTFAGATAHPHIDGALVCSYKAPPAVFAAPTTPAPTGRLVCIGDSFTQGPTDGNAQYDPLGAFCLLAAELLGLDGVNLGIAGRTAASMAGDAGVATHATPADVVVILAGINDLYPPDSTSAADFRVIYQTLVSNVLTADPAATIYCVPLDTPTSGAPSEWAGYNTAIAAVASTSGATVHLLDLWSTLTLTVGADLYDEFHPNASGHAKMALTLAEALGYTPPASGGEEGEMKITPGTGAALFGAATLDFTHAASFTADLTGHLGGGIAVKLAASSTLADGTVVRAVLSKTFVASPAASDYAVVSVAALPLNRNDTRTIHLVDKAGSDQLASGFYKVDITTAKLSTDAGVITVSATLATGD